MMAPVGGKGRNKGREHRYSRSRNTTPSSIGASTVVGQAPGGNTAFLDTPLSQLMVPSNITYDDILERYGSSSGVPDSKQLDTLASDLRILAQLADTRGQACDKGMRDLAKKRKEIVEQRREKERLDREEEERQEKLTKEAALRAEEERQRARKAAKIKKSKEANKLREERPLTHGAHALARQDGADTEIKGRRAL